MFNPELVRVLCEKLASETDPEKLHEMNLLLQAVIKEDIAEVRLRLAFLAKKWGITFDPDDYGDCETKLPST
jgi:hypothetical protein